ncbi:MAG: pyruvate, phosphate dikinase [Candidatus Peregrinibacteria bacterium]|nr:pyruvate, phosphate dikinase [Candidatus Peregrinibacteria bacterium]
MAMTQHVFSFEEGNKDLRDLLGGKGANLAEMTNLGLPVPPGFTITTDVCNYFVSKGSYPEGYEEQVEARLDELEKKMGKKLGDASDPLLVSVRSGAAISMPGMMDTILNLGLNDQTVVGLCAKTGNERFAYDAYRRFVNMFGDVVLGVDHEHFEDKMDAMKAAKGVKNDTDLDAADLKELVKQYKEVVKVHAGVPFPEDPKEQLRLATEAVFKSWTNDRAILYRRIHHVPSSIRGTAVNVQSMVFGNMGDTSGTGVAFTRNPSTGERMFYGEFLMNAQGEDVVAGIRTPQNIEELGKIMPEAYAQLLAAKEKLEQHYHDMQDIEFTIETGRLFMLQTRNGKRTAHAAVKIAVDLVAEGLLTKEQALMKVEPNSLNQLLHPRINPKAPKNVVAKGLPASPGAASGKVVFSAEDAVIWVKEKGEKVILVRRETTPEDLAGMHVSEGILTAQGGMTSHAAVVCRGMGKCCVAGCASISVDRKKRKFMVGDLEIWEGDTITLNGSTGEVMLGEVEMLEPEISGDFEEVIGWADKVRKMRVRANADTPHDATVAREYGAEGIGLCRTEHMFFDESRIDSVREMILAKNVEARKKALAKLLPFQREDFTGLFKAMSGFPVTIRLLDPPLHEFLPQKDEKIMELAIELGVTFEELKLVTEQLHEVNPMLGHRGCRLAITFPEIYEMQVQAIVEACIIAKREGTVVLPEIEMPLIACAAELKTLRELALRIIDVCEGGYEMCDVGVRGKASDVIYKIGSMIELPRACLVADQLAPHSDFFSFGTNDLTQTTWGISRDDVGKFMGDYLDKGVLERDPSDSIDLNGVGELMKLAVTKARSVKNEVEFGICGEHGGEPASVEFCHRIGLDYVSCSPFRVPIARLAAAQAVVREGK